MDLELNQLASAMLVLVLAAVILVTGLLFIERSDRRYDTGVNGSTVLSAAAGPLARDRFVRTSARSRPTDRFESGAETFSSAPRVQ